VGRYQRDKELANERGFGSVRAMRVAERRPTRLEQVLHLPEAARSSRAEADAVVRQARRQRLPIEPIAAANGLDRLTVLFWFPEALKPTRRGRTRVTRADRQLRVRTFISGDERVFVAVKGSRAADSAADANAAQWLFTHGKARRDDVERLGGLRIGGYLVQADPEILIEVARRGEFDPEDLYRELTT
jgi:hypothetical protein